MAKQVTMTSTELREAMGSLKESKYKNRRVQVDGIWFDSMHEADQWSRLVLREKAGHIRNLQRQVKYALVVNGHKVADYYADFVYEEKHLLMTDFDRNAVWLPPVVADAKGFATSIYKLKKKLMKAVHGIEVVEL